MHTNLKVLPGPSSARRVMHHGAVYMLLPSPLAPSLWRQSESLARSAAAACTAGWFLAYSGGRWQWLFAEVGLERQSAARPRVPSKSGAAAAIRPPLQWRGSPGVSLWRVPLKAET